MRLSVRCRSWGLGFFSQERLCCCPVGVLDSCTVCHPVFPIHKRQQSTQTSGGVKRKGRLDTPVQRNNRYSTMVATNTAVMLVLLLLLQLCNYSGVSSFVISTPTIAQRHVGLSAPAFSRPLPGAGAATASVVLFAKKGKKRRKRKETSVSTPDDAAVVETDDNNNELVAQEVEAATMEDLPEFDLAEEEPEPVVSEPAESVVASVSPPSGTVLDGSSSSAMMGGGGGGSGAPVQPLGSVQDLIADRSIEKLMNFEEPESLDVPDFNDYLAKRGTKSGDILPPPGMGKKKARQLQRQQAAMARQQEEEDSKSFLDNIPFLLNEKGEVTAVKVRLLLEKDKR